MADITPTHITTTPRFSAQFLALWQDLILRPRRVIADFQSGKLTTQTVLRAGMIFQLIASVSFSLTTVLSMPPEWHLSSHDLILRFFFALFITFFIFIPGVTLVWALLQKGASWFWSFKLTLKTIFLIAMLGMGYYALMFALSLPVLLLKSLGGDIVQELLLFGLNLSAMALSIRLFQTTYMTYENQSPIKALLSTLSPVGVVIVVIVATQLLSYFAAVHRPGS